MHLDYLSEDGDRESTARIDLYLVDMKTVGKTCVNRKKPRSGLYRPQKTNGHPEEWPECLGKSGSPTWTRTRDLRINSPSLYQLSYQGIVKGEF